MRSISRVAFLAAALLCAVPSFATDVFMPRLPAVSPDGELVVFTFQGDLWSVSAVGGRATRLTAHEAYDSGAIFSPDGTMLAFASDRYGDDDIYVMPVTGGAPRRLTFAATTDRPGAFAPDGGTIFFASGRPSDYPMRRQIHGVDLAGGTPERVTEFDADEVATADGETFIIAEGRIKESRVRYRGSYQREIYSWRRGEDPRRLTDNRGYDSCPMVAPDGTIYWVGDQNEAKTANIWRMRVDGSQKEQLTDFEGDGVRSARLSADGTRIVMERATDLYLLDTAGGRARTMKIDVAADLIDNPVVVENRTGDADELAVAGADDELAMCIEGEIVLVSEKLGGRAAVAVPGPWLEQSIAFKPDTADTLLFVTDRYGEQTVCLLVSDNEEQGNLRKARSHRVVKLTDGKQSAADPQWSPDGEYIAYIEGNADLRVMDADGGNDRSLLDHWGEMDFSWSPDGAWLACSRLDANYNSDVWLIPVDDGEPVNITRHPDYDESPVWSADGRMLAWTTSRHSLSARGDKTDMYFVYLRRADDERTREEWEIWEKTRDDEPEKKKEDDEAADDGDAEDEEGEDEKEAEEKIEVLVDFEDIHLRARRVSDLDGRIDAVAIDPKGDAFYFVGNEDEGESNRDLYSVNRFGEERKRLTKGGADPRDLELDAEGKTFRFLKRGVPAQVGASGGDVETVDFNVRLRIDRPALRLQVLDEAWRMQRDHFYDPDLHGVDWPAMRKKYGEWVQKVSHDAEFALVMNLMLGEINASHMGYYARRQSPGDYGDDGFLGLDFDRTHEGDGLLVASVLPHGPCDFEAGRLLSDDLLKTIDGMPVSAERNLFVPLENMAGQPTRLEVERDGETLEFEVLPTTWSGIMMLQYFETERRKRRLTEEKSDGRVGYAHIQGMGFGEVQRFQQALFAAADGCEALIIDVRHNGGGWTTDLLLTALTQPVHAYTIGRNGEIGYPQTERQPFYRWSKPIAVLCNESSYSNAEIFSHAIKTIGRGVVVGMETGGNVISTWGFRNRYGGYTRLPGRGWYVWGDQQHPERNNKPEEGVHELTGCIPDHIVDLTPADQIHGRDPQLEKAIELMIEAADAEKRKPQPGQR